VVTDEKVKVTDFDEKYGHGARRGMHIRICNCNPSRIVWEKTEEDERDSSRANWEQADPLPPHANQGTFQASAKPQKQ
jgi:hypothetical protein